MGATRDIALNELPFRGISVEPVAASGGDGAVTVVASDSGIIFVNKYVTGDTTYTLPEVADCKGKWFWFFNAQTSYNITVTGGTDAKMIGGGYETYDLMYSADEIGACGMVMGDGDFYYFFPIAHTWTAST